MTVYRQLDPQRIVETLDALNRRVAERFPDSGLSKICNDLLEVGKQARQRSLSIARPLWGLRIGMGVAAVLLVVLLVEGFMLAKPNQGPLTWTELVGVLDAAFNVIVLLGAAIVFLVTVESRIKRSRALAALHELRSLAHVIDMHQLTKDPQIAVADDTGAQSPTPSSPKRTLSPFLLARYLDYCSEMLSLVGKIAALYVERFNDPVLLASVNELESLTTSLSRKIWQKIMLIK